MVAAPTAQPLQQVELRTLTQATIDNMEFVPELVGDSYLMELLRQPAAADYFKHLAREWWLDGECLGLSGFHVVCPGCVEVWCTLTPAARDHPLEYVAEVERQCQWVTDGLLLHRLQATTRADYHKASNLADRVGFQQEGVLRSYRTPGEDYIMWGKLVCPR